MRDCIEIAHTSEYKKFLHFYFPAFEHVLRQRTKPQFAATKENKLRNSIVEILHRLPQNQTLKEHVEKLLLLCTDVLKNDNELNALVALRVIFDVHKNFRPQLEDKLKAFFEYVVEKYRKFPETVKYVFNGTTGLPLVEAPGGPRTGTDASGAVNGAKTSDKDAAGQSQGEKKAEGAEGAAQATTTPTAAPEADKDASKKEGDPKAAGSDAKAGDGKSAKAGEAKEGGSEGEKEAKALDAAETKGSKASQAAAKKEESAGKKTAEDAAAGAKADDKKKAEAAQASGKKKSDKAAAEAKEAKEDAMDVDSDPKGDSSAKKKGDQEDEASKGKGEEKGDAVMVDASATPGAAGGTTQKDDETVEGIVRSTGVDASRGAGGSTLILPSTHSFKVLTECPLIVMFLFHSYPSHINKNVTRLLPFMLEAIAAQPPVTLTESQMQKYADMKAAQVKTVSFLTYLVRSFANYCNPHQDKIAKCVVALLTRQPDSVSVRKELLVATRQFFATDFRTPFYPHLDKLMEENLLVGDPQGQNDTLRPLAYGLLAELIHHMRMQLNIKQLHRIIFIFSRILHDTSLTYSVHVTCVRLLLNLVESIYHQRNANDPSNARDGRMLLGRILDTFTDKFGALKTKAAHFDVKKMEEMKKDTKDPKSIKNYNEKRKARYEYIQLLRTLIMGMKALLWSMTNYAQIRKQKTHTVHPVSPLSEYEVVSVSKLVANGFASLSVLRENEIGSVSDHFASMCQVMDPKNITEVFARHISVLFNKALEHPPLYHVLSRLLLNSDTHAPFADVLSAFFIGTKLDALGDVKSPEGMLVSRLLKNLLSCFGKYHSCEFYMKNRLIPLVQGCLDRAVKTVDCTPYIEVLNLLFHSLAGGKLDKLYQEFLFVLQPTIDAILMILEGPSGRTHRKQIVELCLTLPVRLQNLLPYLSKLMNPILIALKGQDELVNMGLRTLEFWVDSLNPEYLEQEMASIEVELMETLWSHLQPPPYPFGARTLQLLGKLGGRNRRFLSRPLPLEFKSNPEYGLRVILSFNAQTRFLIPLDKCIKMATNVVRGKPYKQYMASPYYTEQAASFLQSCFISLLDLKRDGTAVNREALVRFVLGKEEAEPQPQPMEISTAPGAGEDPSGEDKPAAKPPGVPDKTPPKTKLQFAAEQTQFVALVTSVIITSHQYRRRKEAASAKKEASVAKKEASTEKKEGNAVAEKAEEGKALANLDPFVIHICDHFILMLLAQKEVTIVSSGDQFKKLNPSLFFDSVVATICDPSSHFSEIGLECVHHVLHTLDLVQAEPNLEGARGERLQSRTVDILEIFMSKLIHHCFKLPSLDQSNLMKAISIVYNKIPTPKKVVQIPAILKALFFVLRNLPSHSLDDCREVKRWIKKYLSEELRNAEVDSGVKDLAMKQIIESTVNEALNANAGQIANECATEVLQICSDMLEKPVSTILEPVSKKLLVSILHKPLNSRKLEVQIQALSIATYCINLGPQIIAALTPELMRLVVEAMNICNADQAHLPQIKSSKRCNVSYTDLKAVSVKFLWAALKLPQLDTVGQANLKSKIIPLMFKLLAYPNEKVVSAALEGLSQMVKSVGIPKDLLQQSLRPILLHLQRHSHLTIPLLKGIAKLLELLSQHFNTTLGEKLVNHLKKWLEPDNVANSRHDDDQTKLAAAIIDLFHLLPSQASKFLESTPERPGLVVLTIQLEAHMGIGAPALDMISPYRKPLTKYLNRYADTAIEYFLVRMSNPSYFVRFLDIICSEEGEPLRRKLASSSDKIIKYCFRKEVNGKPKDATEKPAALPPPPQQQQQQQQQQKAAAPQSKDAAAAAPTPTPAATTPATPAAATIAATPPATAAPTAAAAAKPPTSAAPTPAVNPTAPTPTAGASAGASGKEAGGSGGAVAVQKEPPNAPFEGVKLVSVLSELEPDWIVSCDDLVDVLKERWESPERKKRIELEERLPPIQVKESKWLAKCFISYIRKKKLESTDLLFSLLGSLTTKTRVDFTFLRNFLSKEVVETFSVEEKKVLLERFFSFFKTKGEPPEFFAGLEALVFPIFEAEGAAAAAAAAAASGEETKPGVPKTTTTRVMDENLMSCIIKDYLGAVDNTTDSSRSEQHRIAMLKLATSLIKHNSKELVAHRKELIKFGWNHLKREDSTSKCYAFVNVCYFLNAYQAPEKIILQVFVALLRTWQVESRPFINKALDILMPALPHRLQEGNEQQKVPIWNRYVKKILIEEGHIITHTIHLWHLIVRHDKMFYANRAQFVPQMINSLPKLGLLPNSSLENRTLALDLATLILKWEETSIAQEGGEQVKDKDKDKGGEEKVRDWAKPKDGGEDEKDKDSSRKRTKPEDSAPKKDEPATKDKDKAKEAANGASQKMDIDSKEDKEPAAKQMKLGDASAKTTAEKPKAAAGSEIVAAAQKTGGKQEFRLSSAMREMLVNFIIRFSFLCGESADRITFYHSIMSALSKSLKMWPNVTVKIHYLHRLLQSNIARHQDPIPALVAGLEVLRKVADSQYGDFLKQNSNLIVMIMELTFNSKRLSIAANFVYIMKRMFAKYYPVQQQPGNAEVQKLFTHLTDLITKHLSACEKVSPPPRHFFANLFIHI